MSATLILADAWSAYDDYKKATGRNVEIFLPWETYEVNYLVERIGAHYPQYTPLVVELAINQVRRGLYAGCRRSLFVQLVMENLLQRKPFYAGATEAVHCAY